MVDYILGGLNKFRRLSANFERLVTLPNVRPNASFDPFTSVQAIALVDIVKKFNWTYVSTIASEGSYGKLPPTYLELFGIGPYKET